MDLHKMRECPDCASSEIIYVESRDQLVCRECGLVFEELPPVVTPKRLVLAPKKSQKLNLKSKSIARKSVKKLKLPSKKSKLKRR